MKLLKSLPVSSLTAELFEDECLKLMITNTATSAAREELLKLFDFNIESKIDRTQLLSSLIDRFADLDIKFQRNILLNVPTSELLQTLCQSQNKESINNILYDLDQRQKV